jgi:hypothetical protein
MGITVISCVRIEFEEWRLSLLREQRKHDCIVGATIEEFNPSELQKKNDFLQPMGLHICLLLSFYACSLYFEIDW